MTVNTVRVRDTHSLCDAPHAFPAAACSTSLLFVCVSGFFCGEEGLPGSMGCCWLWATTGGAGFEATGTLAAAATGTGVAGGGFVGAAAAGMLGSGPLAAAEGPPPIVYRW